MRRMLVVCVLMLAVAAVQAAPKKQPVGAKALRVPIRKTSFVTTKGVPAVADAPAVVAEVVRPPIRKTRGMVLGDVPAVAEGIALTLPMTAEVALSKFAKAVALGKTRPDELDPLVLPFHTVYDGELKDVHDAALKARKDGDMAEYERLSDRYWEIVMVAEARKRLGDGVAR